MSLAASKATWELLPRLPAMLASVPTKRRPSYPAAALVALYLADSFRDDRGYVDEAVQQIVDATVDLSASVVAACLSAFDALGLWAVTAKGNQYHASRREPRFFDVEHRGADPTEQPVDNPEHRGAKPGMLTEEQRGADPTEQRGEQSSIVGWDPEHRGADPTHPLVNPLNQTPLPPKPARQRARDAIAALAVIETDEAVALAEAARAAGRGKRIGNRAAYETKVRRGLTRRRLTEATQLAEDRPDLNTDDLARHLAERQQLPGTGRNAADEVRRTEELLEQLRTDTANAARPPIEDLRRAITDPSNHQPQELSA